MANGASAAPAVIEVWGFRIASELLDADTQRYLQSLPAQRPDVSWVWREMDRQWDEIARRPECAADRARFLASYYGHPVWLLNGIFTATDPESITHRQAIADRVAQFAPARIADYGGGFGELSRALAGRCPQAQIDIIEPYPSAVGQAAIDGVPQARFAADLNGQFDVVIAQDVLEHVVKPVELAIRMARATRPGGHLVFANCFWPVIKCHLPETFYLRYFFVYVMRGLGLEYVGTVAGAEHAQVFRRRGELDLPACRRRDYSAHVAGNAVNGARSVLRAVWRSVFRR